MADDLDKNDDDVIVGNSDGKDSGKEAEAELILGRFKDPDALKEGYSNLEKDYTKKGQELSFLKSKVAEYENAAKAPAEPEGPSLDDQLQEIADQVKDGNLTVEEGMIKSANISSQKGAQEAMRLVSERETAKTVENSQNTFLETHADFTELRDSGALEQVKNQLPGFHDDVSAYFSMKADANAQAIEVARQEGIAAGKAEAAKIDAGDANTNKIGKQTGSRQDVDVSDAKQQVGQKLTQTQREASMLRAIENLV